MKNFIDILNEIQRVRVVTSEQEKSNMSGFIPKKKKKRKDEKAREDATKEIADELEAKKAARREELIRMGLIPRSRSDQTY